jgi:hypothetical protein
VDLKDIGCEVVDLIYLAQNWVWWWALVKTVMNVQVLLKVGNF